MKYLVIVFALVVLSATLAYAAPLDSVSVKAIAGASMTVPHCTVLYHSIAASDTITSVTANVVCDTSATFDVNATVTSGSSGTGTTSTAFTADVTSTVAITISPSVTIGSKTYDVDINVRR